MIPITRLRPSSIPAQYNFRRVFAKPTRNYGAVVKDFREAYGVEKSAVSENFIASSREKLQELMERPLGELQLCAVLIDGTPFRDRQMIRGPGDQC